MRYVYATTVQQERREAPVSIEDILNSFIKAERRSEHMFWKYLFEKLPRRYIHYRPPELETEKPSLLERIEKIEMRVELLSEASRVCLNDISQMRKQIHELNVAMTDLRLERRYETLPIIGIIIGLASFFYGLLQTSLFYMVGGGGLILIILSKFLRRG